MAKREFVPTNKLEEFDFLFAEKRLAYAFLTGEVMSVDADGAVTLFANDLEGCAMDDPDTWIYAQPATDTQSRIPPRVGQQVLWRFTDGAGGDAKYFGLDRDYETSPNGGALLEVIHENAAGQAVLFDQTAQKYIIQNGTTKTEQSAMAIKMTAGAFSVTIDATGMHITLGGVTFNVLTHMHATAAPGAPSSPTPGT